MQVGSPSEEISIEDRRRADAAKFLEERAGRLPESIVRLGERAPHYLDVVLENFGAGVLLIEGVDHHLVLANQALAELLRIDLAALLAMTRPELVDRIAEQAEDPVAVQRILGTIPANAPYAADDRLVLANPRRVLHWRARPVPLETGVGQLCIYRDITPEVDAADRLTALATKDWLTSLANRRAGVEFLDREIARATREHSPMCVMLFDVDHFKRINDTYGHDVGDKVLRTLASVLSTASRKTDLAVRWGGEEFLSVLVNCTLENATTLARRFQEQLRATVIPPLSNAVTVSIGIASYREGDTLESLVARADAHLYEAKQGGRDRVHTDPTSPTS